MGRRWHTGHCSGAPRPCPSRPWGPADDCPEPPPFHETSTWARSQVPSRGPAAPSVAGLSTGPGAHALKGLPVASATETLVWIQLGARSASRFAAWTSPTVHSRGTWP